MSENSAITRIKNNLTPNALKLLNKHLAHSMEIETGDELSNFKT